tara:strand:+ start:6289 stop:7377 length:1089 start_codon:yes stop_codon:yes gene_type:complete
MPLPAMPRLHAAILPRFTKWIIAIVSVTSAILLVFHTLYWHQGISAAERAIEDWSQAIRDRGGSVELAELHYGGYPFAFEVRAESVAIETMPSDLAWTWQGGAIHGRASIWTPNAITADLSGGHELRLTAQGTDTRSIVGFETAIAEIESSQGGVRFLEAALSNIHIHSTTLTKPVTIRSLGVSGVREHSPGDPVTLRLRGRIHQAQLPIVETTALSTVIEQIAWKLSAKGYLPRSLQGRDLASWRDNGGTIDVESLALRWGALTVDAEGTLSLDKRNRPLAALTATVRGHRVVIDSLVQAGRIRPAEGAAAKIGLSVFSDSAENGGIVLPLTAQNGWLTAGPLRIFPLHSLDFSWLGAPAP